MTSVKVVGRREFTEEEYDTLIRDIVGGGPGPDNFVGGLFGDLTQKEIDQALEPLDRRLGPPGRVEGFTK